MKRRHLTALRLAVTLFAAMPGLAQERTKVARIGFLGLAPASASARRVESLRTGLRDLPPTLLARADEVIE